MSGATARKRDGLLGLKAFQQRARDAAVEVLKAAAEFIETEPPRREAIGRKVGVTLLRAPTGSGKTLITGRTLEAVVGVLPRRTAWIWLTPFAGLVEQARLALASQCPGLRLRDPATDRNAGATRDGDVFCTTWASVASARADARLARRDDDAMPGLDTMLEALRASGFLIGIVVDEAHLNFGTSAPQAAAFYKDVLRPDFTFLVTATPRDEDLDRFSAAIGLGDINRIEIARDDVVREGLNKVGVKVVHFRPEERDKNLLDTSEIAVWAGLRRHEAVRDSLRQRGIDLVPLMLVQVANRNEAEGGNPVERVREILAGCGVAPERIAVHTADEPDPAFHALAFDETKDVLVFKMSAATGFDAPRAWTLVSLRPSVGPTFGIQVLGRIMRVHSRLQPFAPFAANPPLAVDETLDYGHVFLSDAAQQGALVEAARSIKAIQAAVETVSDNVQVVEIDGRRSVLLDPDGGFAELLATEDEAARAEAADGAGEALEGEPSGGSRRHGEEMFTLRAMSLLDGLEPAVVRAPRGGTTRPSRRPDEVDYALRDDLDFPKVLAREVMPQVMGDLLDAIVSRVRLEGDALSLVRRALGKVHLTEQEVFGDSRRFESLSVPLSAARIAVGAQASFRFNEDIDERDLRPRLVQRLRETLEREGQEEMTEAALRRGVDLLAFARPWLLTDACRSALAERVEVRQDEPIPTVLAGPPGLEPSRLSVYGVFPPDLNKEEMAFARLLDGDTGGNVRWWLRNVSNARWAVSIVLPNGERHFPDFIVGASKARRSDDHVALLEVKDDGETGRLFADRNGRKVRSEHSRYKGCVMLFRGDDDDWIRVVWQADLRRHGPGGKFELDQLIWLN